MNPKNLSNTEIVTHLQSIVTQERNLLDEFLVFLREADRRKLYASQGYSSLFSFLVKELAYDEATAFRRIDLMRAIREVPEIEASVRAGELSITSVGIVQSYIRAETKVRPVGVDEKKALFNEVRHKSKIETERLLMGRASVGGFQKAVKREQVRTIAPALTEVRVNADAEFVKNLERLKELHFHISPIVSLGEILNWAMTIALKHVDPFEKIQRTENRKSRTPMSSSVAPTPAPASGPFSLTLSPVKVPPRRPPAHILRQVWKRDQGVCQYVSAESEKRCAARAGLEVDHVQSWTCGGGSDLGNLELLCSAHHQCKTEREFGRRF